MRIESNAKFLSRFQNKALITIFSIPNILNKSASSAFRTTLSNLWLLLVFIVYKYLLSNKPCLLYKYVSSNKPCLHAQLQKHNVSVKSRLQHPPPPPGIPRAFDVFFCPGGGNLINFIFPGAGIYSLGVGNLIASLDFMLRVALIQAVHEGR